MHHLVCVQSDIVHDFLTKIYKYVDARMADPDALDWEEKHCNANIYEHCKVGPQLSEKIEVIFSVPGTSSLGQGPGKFGQELLAKCCIGDYNRSHLRSVRLQAISSENRRGARD
jgi:hypothetical protein